MSLDRTKILRNLPKKGFKKVESGHHIYFHHVYQGKETGPYTFVSHSAKIKTYDAKLVSKMRSQLRLDHNKQVQDLCNCPMSGADYNEILISNGIFKQTD